MHHIEVENVETCDLCGSSMEAGIRLFPNEPFGLIECRDCGLVMTSPRPTEEEIGNYYPDHYYAHNIKEKTPVQRFKDKLKVYKGKYPEGDNLFWSFLTSLFKDLFLYDLPYMGEGKRLLEIGCGVGESLLWAQERGWEVCGMELDTQAVDLAKKRGLRVEEGNAENLDYPDNYFDCILIYHTLEHVYSPTKVLIECHNVLRRFGSLLIAVPNFDCVGKKVLKSYWHLDIPKHCYHFTEDTLRQLTNKCGFDVTEARYNSKLATFILNMVSLKNSVAAMRKQDSGVSLSKFVKSLIKNMLALSRASQLRISDVMFFICVKR